MAVNPESFLNLLLERLDDDAWFGLVLCGTIVIAFMSLGLYRVDAPAAILCFVEMPVKRIGAEGKDINLVGGVSDKTVGLDLELPLLLATDLRPFEALDFWGEDLGWVDRTRTSSDSSESAENKDEGESGRISSTSFCLP